MRQINTQISNEEERDETMLFTRPVMSIHDKRRLAALIEHEGQSWTSYAPCIDSLRAQLGSARVVSPTEVPDNMITMNSRFALKTPDDDVICYTLVYPGSAATQQGRISVLSPMGKALLGARVGEEVCWVSHAGPQVAVVKRLLYQPEASGHFHL